jgi:hypothetical protein
MPTHPPHGANITITAMNYDDITDLAAEAELWIGGEKPSSISASALTFPPTWSAGRSSFVM